LEDNLFAVYFGRAYWFETDVRTINKQKAGRSLLFV
jgi:hypothetical protein